MLVRRCVNTIHIGNDWKRRKKCTNSGLNGTKLDKPQNNFYNNHCASKSEKPTITTLGSSTFNRKKKKEQGDNKTGQESARYVKTILLT